MSDCFYRLLFLDLDGTIIDETETVPAPVARAIDRAAAAGCTPVICTGRSRYKTRHIARQIGVPTWGIHFNGTVIHDWGAGITVRRTPLSPEQTAAAIGVLRRLGLPPLCYGVDEDDRWVYADRSLPPPEHYAAGNAERLVSLTNIAADLQGQPVSIETYGTPEAAVRLSDAWRETLGDSVCIYRWSSPANGGCGLHIHSALADKAEGARVVADILGVPQERTAAIGDAVNDAPLLRWAGLGVCMGDGGPEARACADRLTGTLAEHGAAQAIDQWVLGDGTVAA